MLYLFLTHFNIYYGPIIYLTVPEKVTYGKSLEKVREYFDLSESFFEINIVEDGLKTINLYIELISSWARGGREMTMLSIVTDKNYKNSIFFDVLKEAENKFNYAQNIYKGFYIKDVEYKNDPEVQLKYEEIKKILLETYNKIEERAMSAVIGNLLILGLDRVGKTTILEYLKKKAFTSVKPTLALTLIEQIIDSYLFKIIDVSGQKKLRDQWWMFTKHPDAIIFVIDINDIQEGERLEETKEEINKIIDKFSSNEKNKLDKNTILLFCVNKIDLYKGKLPKVDKIKEIFKLTEFKGIFTIEFTSTVTGQGIEKSFKWLVTKLLNISKS